jgi:hypothetical protein
MADRHRRKGSHVGHGLLAVLLMPAPVAASGVSGRSPPPAGSASEVARQAQNAADAAAMAADAAAGPPRGTALELRLRDLATGRPVQGAGLHLRGHPGLGRTDQAGRNTWYLDDAYATGDIEVRCPATRALTGRRISKVPFSMEGKVTVVTARIPLAECTEPPERSVAGTYAGYYQAGFENSRFVPCEGLPADAGFYGKRSGGAWVELDAGAFRQLRSRVIGARDAERGIYVVWEGVMTGPGSYGHMGVSSYRLQVTRVLDTSATLPADCPARGQR